MRVALAILIPLVLAALLVVAIGENPVDAALALARGVAGSPAAVGSVLFQTTTLLFLGLSVALPYRAGFFNIGSEGQLLVGGFAATLVALALPDWPAFVLVPTCALAAALGGGLWGALPGILRAKLGVHEVINTIMLNFIASAATSYFVVHVFQEPGQMIPHTSPIPVAAWLPRCGDAFGGLVPIPASSPFNVSFLVAAATLLAVAFVVHRTPAGFALRAVGESERAARFAGISPGRTAVFALGFAGALAGLASLNEIMGFRHRFVDNFTGGIGFLGIAVALLGGGTMRGVFFSALLFGALSAGAVEVDLFTRVPREIFLVLQALLLLSALALSRRSPRESGATS